MPTAMSSKTKCCICLEDKNIFVNCLFCKDGNYCIKCFGSIINNNTNNKCAICRQEKWYDKKTCIIINNYKKALANDHNANNDNANNNNANNNNANNENYVYINKYFNCVNLFIALVCFAVLTAVGLIFLSIVCEYKVKKYESETTNAIIMVLVSCLTGLGITIFCSLIIYFNNKIYNCVLQYLGQSCAGCLCNPIVILWLILFSMLITYLGVVVGFEIVNIQLEVNKEHEIILKIVIGYLIGISIITFLTIMSLLVTHTFTTRNLVRQRSIEIRSQSIETTIDL